MQSPPIYLASCAATTTSRRLDAQNGLTYREKVVGLVDNRWHLRCKGRMTQGKGGKYRSDVAENCTLYQTAIRKIVLLLQSEPDTFDFRLVPWRLIRPAWSYMFERDLVSLGTWKTFAAAYGQNVEDDINGLKHYIMNAQMFIRAGTWSQQLTKIASPSLVYEGSAGPLNQPPMSGLASQIQFLVFLEVSNVAVDRLDLLFLPQIPNLGTLSLGPGLRTGTNSLRGIDEGIFRSWAEQAHTVPDALRALRTLQIVQAGPVSKWAMASLSRLPSLSLVTFVCKYWDDWLLALKQYVQRKGWVERSPQILFFNGCEGSLRPKDLYKSNSQFHAACEDEEKEARRCENLPVLHFQLVGSFSANHQIEHAAVENAVSFTRSNGNTCGVKPEMSRAEDKKRKRSQIDDDGAGQRHLRRRKLEDVSKTIGDLMLG